jgi:hypothetical protein
VYYGPVIPDPVSGQLSDGTNQWSAVHHEAGRVLGFIYAMPAGTSQAAAMQQIMAQLPPDSITTTPIKVLAPTPGTGSVCAVWNLRSPTLARLLGPPPIGDTAGDIGIVLSTAGPDLTMTYNRNSVDTAGVSLFAYSLDNNC